MRDLALRNGNWLVWLLLLSLPFWFPLVGGYTALGTRVLVMAIAAMAVNFLLGFTGVLSFGHAAYLGLGAYAAGMTIKYWTPSTPLGFLLGIGLGTLGAMVIGAMIVRLRGVYFAMVTIAFGQVFYFIAFRWSSVTGGDDGLSNWKRAPLDLGFITIDIQNDDRLFYYLVLVCLAVAAGLMAMLLRSPFGRTLLAIRENERRARFLGIPIEHHIWLSFTISGAIASLAGCVYAYLDNFVDPRAFHWSQSGEFVIMAVLGGMRSFWGPLVGAAIFEVLQDMVSSRTDYWMSILGTFFVLVVVFFPRGVLGLVQRRSAAKAGAP